MDRYEEFHKIMQSWETAGSVPEDKIAEVEKKLGTKFPAKYREFLSMYGAAMTEGFEVAGIFEYTDRDVPPMWLDVGYYTRVSVSLLEDTLPNKEQIYISSDGGDYTFYLDTRPENYGKILELGPGIERFVADDFHDFIIKISNDKIFI